MTHLGKLQLSNENVVNNDNGFERLCDIRLETLNKHALSKKKHARDNQIPFFNKELSKAIMTRIKLRNIFQQNRSEESRMRYTKQGKLWVSLLTKTDKKIYCENLNKKSVVDNKLFWKNVKLFQSEKVSDKGKIHLIKNNKLVTTGLETVEVFNNFFCNILQILIIRSIK